jgi:hypothetical protein
MDDVPDSLRDFLYCAEEMLGKVLNDVEPYNRPEKLVHMLFFRRFTELQCEYCRAIRALYESKCLPGALPVLRSLVEVSVAQLQLQHDADFSALLDLLKGERVKMQPALKQVNWPASQSDIYARLSNMTHPTRISAFQGRTLDFESEPLKSLVARQDLAGIASVILWTGGREDDAARQDRWVFVALNTFDMAISSLFTLYGERAPESGWWRPNCISLFETLAENYPNMKHDLLWFRPDWPHSKLSKMEQDLRDLFNADTDGD